MENTIGIKLINATDHQVVYCDDAMKLTTYEPSGIHARITFTEKKSTLGIVNFSSRQYGEVKGLPPEEFGVYYIVSSLCLMGNKNSPNPRTDLITPDTGKTAIRSTQSNQVIAIKNFIN
ncbi:MAG: hypothetical protein ACRCX2_21655 [Paraclostridium sp.]